MIYDDHLMVKQKIVSFVKEMKEKNEVLLEELNDANQKVKNADDGDSSENAALDAAKEKARGIASELRQHANIERNLALIDERDLYEAIFEEELSNPMSAKSIRAKELKYYQSNGIVRLYSTVLISFRKEGTNEEETHLIMLLPEGINIPVTEVCAMNAPICGHILNREKGYQFNYNSVAGLYRCQILDVY